MSRYERRPDRRERERGDAEAPKTAEDTSGDVGDDVVETPPLLRLGEPDDDDDE